MSNRGGKRPGAGRKPGSIAKARLIKKAVLQQILDETSAENIIKKGIVKLSKSEDEKILLNLIQFLTEHRFGKATQRTELSGTDGDPVELVTDVKISFPDIAKE